MCYNSQSVVVRAVILALCVPPAHADQGDDFVNNLLTDLAPIIALFGEKVVMQFLSQSLGLADCVALAMAPIGIITIIVSAIRVGGPRWLKAIIGRARENTAAAEVELMSSTSRETCELWNGKSVVRCQGSGGVWQFICLVPDQRRHANEPYDIECMSLKEATKKHTGSGSPKNSGTYLREADITASSRLKHWLTKWLSVQTWTALSFLKSRCSPRRPRPADQEAGICMSSGVMNAQAPNASTSEVRESHDAILQSSPSRSLSEHGQSADSVHDDQSGPKPTQKDQVFVIRETSKIAPNMALNCHDRPHRREIILVAIGGIILQVGVLIWSGFSVRKPLAEELKKNDKNVEEYALLLIAIGTVMLTLGLLICGWVVERSTKETFYEAAEGYSIHLVWLQKGGAVNDQDFKPFAVMPIQKRSYVTISRRNPDFVNEHDNKPNPNDGTDDATGDAASNLNAQWWTISGCVIALIGFFSQFTGLRGMNYSVPIAQFLAMAIMTCARAFVRRGLVVSPSSEVLQQDFELDWFAKSFENPNPSWMNKQTWFSSKREQKLSLSRSGTCRPNTQDIEGSETCDRYAQHILSIRLRLAKLSDWRGPASNEAILLAEAVEAVASELLPHSRERFVGKFEVVLKGKICSFLLNLELVQGSWRARADEFEALLSLWLSTFVKEEGEPKVNQLNDNDSWLRVQRARDTGLRILGHAPEAYGLLRDLRLWLPEDVEEILEIEDDAHTDFIFEDEQVIDVANHRVVGDGASRVVNKAQISTRFRIRRAIDMRIVDFDKGDSAFDSMKPRSYEYILGRDSGSTFGSSDYRLPTEDIEESWLLSGLRREFHLNGSFLAIRSSDSLEHLFARQILSSLVKSFARERVCRDGKPASSNNYPESSCKGDSDWRTCEMKNIKVSKVVRKLVNTGFLSLADAHLDIVAALSIAQHLPSPSIIFRHLKHKMNEAFSNSSYDRFEDAFMSLLELAVTFETPGTTLAPQALAICHYYFEMLTYAFTVGSREVRYDDPLKDCVERLEPVVQEMLYPKTESSLPGPWSVFADQFSIWWTRTECPTMPKHMRTERLDAERFQLSKQHISAVMPDPDGTGHDNDPEYVERMTPDVFQWTPVHYLAAIGVRRAVREPYPYYRPNTCFNSVDIFGLSPLHYACSRGRTSAVEYLLIRGALVDVEQENGISPMHLAAASGNTEVVQLLLVELTKKEFQQRNVRGKTKSSTAKDFNGRVPIHWATMKGHVGIVKLLSVDMNVTDKFGLSCLHLAVLYQHKELVHWLVEQSGCNVDALDATQRSPLQLAATRSNVEMVQLLVKRGAHIDVADGTPKSYTPFHYAVKNRNLEIFDSLLGDDETRKHLGRLSARQAVLMKCSSGYNALFCVARKLIRNEEDLITAGAMARDVIDLMDSSDVNMQVDGLTALHWACLTASSAVVESLLHGEGKGRASIKIKDSKGRMPLDFIREKLLVANYDHQDDLQEFNVRWRETEDIKYRLGSSFGFFALGIAPEFDESEMEEFEKGPITYDARQGIMGIERMLKRYDDLYI